MIDTRATPLDPAGGPSSGGAALDDARVALAHDWLVGLRGGEFVLDRLARRFGPCPLYTLVADGRPLTAAIDACAVVTSPLQRLPGAAGRWRRHYLPLMPWAVGRLDPAPCDLLISTSSAVMKSIRPPAGAVHLCYCHTPPRYIWEQSADYAHGAGGRIRSLGLASVRRPFQRWDRRTAGRVTRFVANSRHTAERIRRCYDREATVIHPPVRTSLFTPGDRPREEFLLVVSALEPYKRVDLAIEAANRLGRRLLVAGSGTLADDLSGLAGPTVEMLGRVSDDRLLELYRTASALLYPQTEDFGIIAVEAQSCGCPVIAHGAGGALDSVTERTGICFEEQRVEAVTDAIRRFDRASIDASDCRANALRFSEERFDEAIVAAANATLGER